MNALGVVMEATMLDFRRRMGDIEAALARRERVNVRSHGRQWAVLVAWEDAEVETPKARDCAAAGMWADRDDLDDPTACVRKMRSRRMFA